MTASAELVQELSSGVLQNRTGIALVPAKTLNHFQVLAVQWGAEAVSLIERWIRSLPPGTRYSGIRASTILEELSTLAESVHQRPCLLVSDLDILLAHLEYTERASVWQFLFEAMRKKPTALLFLMPIGSEHLLSLSEIDRWSNAGRLSQPEDSPS